MRSAYSPCLPTSAKIVPSTPNWLHEVKYDGYRLIVARDGDRVRLFTRNGHDWSGRFPWIVESALKSRHSQFVVDGEFLGRATLATLFYLRLVPAHRLVSL